MNNEERTQKLAAFTRNSPNPLLEFSADGSLAYYNEATRRLALSLGFEAVADTLPPDCKEIVVQCLEGRVAYNVFGKTLILEPGKLLYMPMGEPHSVQGIEDASLLLTIFLPKQ